ncbi:unnamed protein product (macronuclear) [Paramecium tetraurelia]|uniref:5' exonuclease Apollo n=1 Tax=Paramecium tetraurelia TaxID=5888 RepID=Q3SE65_PARTE|nr:uncharacterized protein GSPATT00027258001 [Paramecium tetraurelia]CAI39059.1 Putative DNA interstrand cross-link repair protein [Paramecium tetraurelia]CAK94931.1 unnamed protein product [Paramecium tetraurelia]|eukprot:XP_001462304.1 hypothetical protein (macronuclear) [Paramecium tetraurelia strain d4-2]
MVLISYTNIIVDDFGYARRNPLKRYIYFLTHMHSDHYQGISNGWDYGQIFCSTVTKALLLVKFPGVKGVMTIPMKTPTEIELCKKYKVKVTFLDANHCPGAVMILFQGYFGTILHTGDMRFNMEMIPKNPQLYPPQNISNENGKCSIDIDELILDNTYCDPIFKFPNRDEAFKMLCEIIDKNPNNRVFLCVDSVGKEELMVELAKHYDTVIVVNEQRYEIVTAMNFYVEYFTLDKTQGWIEVIRKGEVEERLKDKNTIAITATGWANTTSYQMPDNRRYVIPYSLHSNFNEMHQFVKSIQPALLQKVVKNNTGKSSKIYNITQFSQYMVTLHHIKQRGFEFFLKNYTDEKRLSQEYRSIMMDSRKQREINQELGIELSEQDHQIINQTMFQDTNQNIFQKQKQVRKGYKFEQPETNKNFKITQFIRAKKQLVNTEKALQQDVIPVDKEKRKDNNAEITEVTKQTKDPIIID